MVSDILCRIRLSAGALWKPYFHARALPYLRSISCYMHQSVYQPVSSQSGIELYLHPRCPFLGLSFIKPTHWQVSTWAKTGGKPSVGSYYFFRANIHNFSLFSNLKIFINLLHIPPAASPFPSKSQSIDHRSNPSTTCTVYQCWSRRGSLEGGISEMRCVITGDDDEQRMEMVRFSVLLYTHSSWVLESGWWW